VDFWDFGVDLSLSDDEMSWLRLKPLLECIPHPYDMVWFFYLFSKSAQAASAQREPQGAKPEHTSCPDQAAPGCPDH